MIAPAPVYPCPRCDYPLVWNEQLQRRWCSIYGSHRKTEPPGAELVRLILHDDELHAGRTRPFHIVKAAS